MRLGMAPSGKARDEKSHNLAHSTYRHLFENHQSDYKRYAAAAGGGQTW